MNPTTKKTLLRAQMKNWRAGQSAAAAKKKSVQIARQVLSWSILQQAQTVFCYVSSEDEVGTHFLLKELIKLGKTVAVPKITGPGEMKSAMITDFSELVLAKHNILAPQKLKVLKQKIDLNLMPAIAVDLQGHRLGMGGGFYDRFLTRYQSKVNAVMVFAKQVLNFVPTDESDKLVDVVITEKGLYTITQPNFN